MVTVQPHIGEWYLEMSELAKKMKSAIETSSRGSSEAISGEIVREAAGQAPALSRQPDEHTFLCDSDHWQMAVGACKEIQLASHLTGCPPCFVQRPDFCLVAQTDVVS